jgi:type VI secretion system secreted protein VgrG
MPPPAATEVVMTLTTSQGDALQFRSVSAREEMSRLYEFNVMALSEGDAVIDTGALLGTDAVVTIQTGHDGPRYLHGMVARAGLESSSGSLVAWRLQLRPWLWKLTRRADTRIFQNMTVEAIIKKVFENYTGDVVFELQGAFAPRVYCVQYRETDFNFVCRLLEEEGMYFFHRHTRDKHTLVICNAMTSHADVPGYASIKYRDSQDQMTDLEAITEWRHTHELTTGKVVLTDYDFLKPATSLLVDHSSTQTTAPAALEHYDYPGLYTEKDRGRNLARVRMQELDAHVLRVSGATTTVPALCVGYRFALQDHVLASENTDHVVLSTHIEAQYAGYESGQGENQFHCRFSAMRYAHVYRPDRSTPKPVIPGPQTAVVVGPSGEEIYTDEHGRVKVQFHWDRLGTNDDNSSCWLRVASQWAGKAWGMISLPRIGQEVVVDFLEGDPDQPLVTSRVYNAVQVPPYALPDNKTVSTIKSQSSKGGTTANANELRFEDKKDSEYIWFQAEKDMRHLVKHNSNTWIKANEHRIIGGNFTEKIHGKQQVTVDGLSNQLTKGDHNVTTDANMQLEAVGKFTLWSGDDTVFECPKTYMNFEKLDMTVSDGAKVNAGTVDIKADKIVLEATQKISLKVGGSFVTIDPSGVSIKGPLVNINTGGSADSAASAQDKDPSEAPVPELPAKPEDPLTPAA